MASSERHHRPHTSSSTTTSSSSDRHNNSHHHQERTEEERRRQKELIKALETPEQKRARRLAKKEEKERKRQAMAGWDDEYSGYTNEDNPFGDSNLRETFIWGKKYEKLGLKSKLDEEQIRAINRERAIRNRHELEKVKQRRLEREREREERAEEMSQMQRAKEAEQFKEWAKQEDYFHLKQAKLRSKLRIREGRAKPIDILARYINVFGDATLPSEAAAAAAEDFSDQPKREEENEDTVKANARRLNEEDREELADRLDVLQQRGPGALSEPYNALNGLRIRDLEDLEADIRVYLELDSGAEANADYWRNLQVIVEDELAKLKLANMDLAERRREGINPSVSAEISRLLAGKTPAQLVKLQTQILAKIHSKEEGIDIGYWETMLARLKAQIARAHLRTFHEANLGRRAQLIATFQQQLRQMDPRRSAATATQEKEVKVGGETEAADDEELKNDEVEEEAPAEEEEDELRFLSAAELEQKCLQDYRSGGTAAAPYSPRPLPVEELPTGALIISAEDRARELDEQRAATLKRLLAFPTPFVQFDRSEPGSGSKKGGNKRGKKGGDKAAEAAEESTANYDHNALAMTRDEEAFLREARRGMADDEAVFSVEEQALLQAKDRYSWSEKYRPRKPRYFNRVHTGFEWNKYNQTHYDVDNPPPKVVQGYKFNIFYPDLIDKSTTPSYKITACPENRDFAFIRFTAGPPYEDLCFKIVNREWNYSYKSGFRSQFQNNILQLWFHFKRYRYRR